MAELLPGPTADLDALRRFASVRLVVADLDGTLFPSDLAGTMQRLLRQLNYARVQLTLATGRTFSGVRDLLSHLQDRRGNLLLRRGTPLILYNGSVVIEAGTQHLIQRNTMTSASFTLALNTAARHPCELFAYFCDEEVLSKGEVHGTQERVFGWQFRLPGKARAEREFNGLPVRWDETLPLSLDLQPCAVVVSSPHEQVLVALAAELEATRTVSVTRSGFIYLELRPKGTSKGTALAWVTQRLGLTADEVLAVGDSDNDVEMLKWAGIGVAVSTASSSARNHADFLCHYGPFQGVVQVLRLVCEAHRYYRGSHHTRLVTT